MIQVSRRPLSLETPTDNEDDSVLGDFIEDNEIPAPDETATYNLLKEHLEIVMDSFHHEKFESSSCAMDCSMVKHIHLKKLAEKWASLENVFGKLKHKLSAAYDTQP